MQITVELRDMFHYEWYSILLLLLLLLLVILLYFLPKIWKKKPKPVIIPKNKDAIKRKYLIELEKLYQETQNQTISNRLAFQKLSETIRLFIYEMTDIQVQNYSLEEIKSLDMPMLYELIKNYYSPEFEKISEGNIHDEIMRAKKVIEEWN